MNYKTFLQEGNRYFVHNQRHLRYGQALMNYLWNFDKSAYHFITGQDVDPFYDDERVPEFLNALINYWSE